MELIVAVYENWGIGRAGTQPIVIPEDRKHFRSVTGSATVIVSDRTMLDFPGSRPLKGRRNIILSIDPSFTCEGAEVARSIPEAVGMLKPGERAFVIGGASVYRQMLPLCERAYLTKLYCAPECDVFFPDLDAMPNWRVVEQGSVQTSGDIAYRFLTYKNDDVKTLS